MSEANKILKYIKLNEAMPVIRHGSPVEYIENKDNYFETITKIIDFNLSANINSIAIITKDLNESNKIYSLLSSKYKNIKNIKSSDKFYENGISVITSSLSKGLEFDVVIIADASEEKYNSNIMVDMKLLFVSMTRAMQQLYVLHNDKITKPLIIG